jgi:hypothetical protein
MKNTIFALSLAAVAAMAASTGASATFFGNGEYYDSGKANYDHGYPDYRTDRHFTDKPVTYSDKHSWSANSSYCLDHPSNWKCQQK